MLLVRYGDNFALKYASQTPMRTTARQVVVSRENCILAEAAKGFRSVRIYTVGKRMTIISGITTCFRSVRIYTVGKLELYYKLRGISFRSVRIYTVGKQRIKNNVISFRSVRI